MVGPWFTTPWRLVSNSHGANAWRFWPPFPSHVPFPFATYRHRPNPRVPWFSVPMGPLCAPCHSPVLAPCPHLIPHPLFIPHQAASDPTARAHSIIIHPGTVSCSLHGSLLSTPPPPRTRPPRVVWPLFPCHGTFGPPMFWHENTACPGRCGLAGTPLHVPPLGLGGELCSVFCILAPPAVLPSLTTSGIPPMAHCPSVVCPSTLLAEGPSFCCSPHTWLGHAAVCVICALGHAGCAAHVFHLCLCTRTQRVFFFGWRLWPSRDATTRMPARAWLDGVLRCRAPPASWCPC